MQRNQIVENGCWMESRILYPEHGQTAHSTFYVVHFRITAASKDGQRYRKEVEELVIGRVDTIWKTSRVEAHIYISQPFPWLETYLYLGSNFLQSFF